MKLNLLKSEIHGNKSETPLSKDLAMEIGLADSVKLIQNHGHKNLKQRQNSESLKKANSL